MSEPLPVVSRHRAARRLAQRAERDGDPRLLDEAIAELRETAGPVGRPGDLAAALYHRFELTGEEPALRSAVETYRTALEPAGRATMTDLSGLGVCLVRLHERTGDEDTVDEAVTVLRASTAGLPPDEPGASGVWANLGLALLRQMERSGDLGPLDEAVAAHEHAAATTVTAPATHARILANLGNTLLFAGRRAGDGDRLDAAVTTLRRAAGIVPFGHPPRADDLREAAAGRVTIVVNVSRHRCDALVLTGGATRLVPLPDLSLDDAVGRVAGLRSAPDLDAVLPATLAWLWDTVVGPVLDAGVVPPDRPVWWVPTGPLSLLPLHAAGHRGAGGADRRCALERVVSSYAPTVASLGRAGHRPAEAPVVAPVVFSLPETAGRSALPGAAREADLVRSLFGAAVTVVPPEQTTRAAVLARLAEADWVHFACHATDDPLRPSDGHLVLRDGPLRIREIAGRSREGALAYLSACATARGNIRLPDESIHICTAFQLAGFTTVVGNLWEVPDPVAVRGVRNTYAALAAGSVAQAVNQSARRLRGRYPGRPSTWAGIVHIGADRSLSRPPAPASAGRPA